MVWCQLVDGVRAISLYMFTANRVYQFNHWELVSRPRRRKRYPPGESGDNASRTVFVCHFVKRNNCSVTSMCVE